MLSSTRVIRNIFIISVLANAACRGTASSYEESLQTGTPIKHLVVIFQENVSFDHYFGTYPHVNPTTASNFHAQENTPTINGLTEALLTNNPNSHAPFLLTRANNYVCSQRHTYEAQQRAYDSGLADRFVEFTGRGCAPDWINRTDLVMGYYDGNTVTALWNYAQHYALSDNFYGTTFGPSTIGAINLISGNTNGVNRTQIPGYVVAQTLVADAESIYEDFHFEPAGPSPRESPLVAMNGRNIGDLLNAKSVTWGWFDGGFRTPEDPARKGQCFSSRTLGERQICDYVSHHEPFQFYATTANPHHLRATSPLTVGHTDAANHQYDLLDFWEALAH